MIEYLPYCYSKRIEMLKIFFFFFREKSRSPADPKFIVTLDGVDPHTYEVIPEHRPQIVQVSVLPG